MSRSLTVRQSRRPRVSPNVSARFWLCLRLCVCAIGGAAAVVSSATINVPGDHSTIQAAINAAASGDTINVAGGTYYENLVINKGITLSGADAVTTIVDGSYTGTVLSITGGPTVGPVVEELTLRNGQALQGGGVRIDAAATVRNCAVTDSVADQGGGVWIGTGGAALENCTITGNTANDSGGGISVAETALQVTIIACVIGENSATTAGGGVESSGQGTQISDCEIGVNSVVTGGGGLWLSDDTGATEVVNCTIEGNEAVGMEVGGGAIDGGMGGGIQCWGFTGNITDCIIGNNTAHSSGGGITLDEGSTPSIDRCMITGNNAGIAGGGVESRGAMLLSACLVQSNTCPGGGGIWCGGDGINIRNCIISGNESPLESDLGLGGGIQCCCCDPTITNCTIVNNSADVLGGGLWCGGSPPCGCDGGSNPTVINTIFAGNGDSAVAGPASITYSLFWNNADDDQTWVGVGNIVADPLFADAPNGDFHLTAVSPAINGGTATGAPPDDIDGEMRPSHGFFDIGADEFAGDLGTTGTVPALSDWGIGLLLLVLGCAAVRKQRTIRPDMA